MHPRTLSNRSDIVLLVAQTQFDVRRSLSQKRFSPRRRPMIWDRKSILTTIGFFGGAIFVAQAACMVLDWFGGDKVTLLNREEAARLAREEGCKCHQVRPSTVAGANNPRKEAYVCNCPPATGQKTGANLKTQSKAQKKNLLQMTTRCILRLEAEVLESRNPSEDFSQGLTTWKFSFFYNDLEMNIHVLFTFVL
ncbi:uncharacterized protein LOC144134904 [Amblyomma americanum]